MLAFSNDYYGMIFRATQSVELFCAYFQTKPKAIKGYYVDKDSVRCGIHSSEYYGYGFVRYILVKLE